MKESLLQYYTDLLGKDNMPDFLPKYLNTPSLLRLKKVGYFCGMDYASRDIYDFGEYISRYDHSITVALITYRLSYDKTATLAGLFHDIATPCFSHVIDYMNKDYELQESTETYTERILNADQYLLDCLKQDQIDVAAINDFKKYTLVDNARPKVCADRLDGIILNGIGWTKNISQLDIKNIVEDMQMVTNEFGELEIGFDDEHIVKKILEVNKSIDVLCHSTEDNYMMELLADIVRLGIEKSYIKYDDLYRLTEGELFDKLITPQDATLNNLLCTFKTIKRTNIPTLTIPKVKTRSLNPLVKMKRSTRS